MTNIHDNPLLLTTESLQLRPIQPADAAILHTLWTHPAVRKYLWDDVVIPVAKVKEIIALNARYFADHQWGLWLITLKRTKEVIGFSGLWYFFDENQPQLLYGLHPDYWHQGYAVEASRKVIEYAFQTLGFTYLIASCDKPNIASIKVAEKLGMQWMKEEEMDGKATVFYRLDAESWTERMVQRAK